MNKYQQEIAEMDRHQQVVRRTVSLLAAGALAVVALWSAGFPPGTWFDGVQPWFAQTHSKSAASPLTHSTPTPAPVPEVMPALAPAATDAVAQLPGLDSSLSPVPLPLLLISTSPGRNAREGTAQMGTAAANPQTYSAGALLLNGARLEEIHGDFVVLRRGDRTAKLYVYKQQENDRSTGPDDLLTVGGRPVPALHTVARHHSLTDYLRPSPVYDGPILRGYQVYPGSKAQFFSQLGLEPGDVITAIDGTPLIEPTQAMEAFQQLTAGIAVTATLERRQIVHKVSLDGALLVADVDKSAAVQQPLPPSGEPMTGT